MMLRRSEARGGLLVMVAWSALALGLTREARAEMGLPASAHSLEIRGSGAMGPLARSVVELFLTEHPDATVTIQTCGSYQGLKSLIVETSEMAMGTDEVPEELAKLAHDRGVDLIRTDVYRDALAAVVHARNPVKSLTVKQLRDIFRGAIANWADVGGVDVPIAVWSLPATSATYEVFKRLVLGPGAVLTPRVLTVAGKQIQEGLPENAISYVGLGQVARWNLTPVTIGGVLPSTKTVADGSYPIVRHMSLYQRAPATPLGKELVETFLAPDKGRRLILEAGNVPEN
jgi:phosphate transport system substrate-binding protein